MKTVRFEDQLPRVPGERGTIPSLEGLLSGKGGLRESLLIATMVDQPSALSAYRSSGLSSNG